MNLKVEFRENNAKLDVTPTEQDRSFSVEMSNVQTIHGKDGENGASAYEIAINNGFTGSEAEWLLSLHGPNGKDGADGKDGKDGKNGVDGKNGLDGTNGKDGVNGTNGTNGKDGMPCTHRWSGTTLYVTSASGTSYANLKGENGKDGINGNNGKDGYTPIKGVDYFDGKDGKDGADGKNGINGTNGKDGVDGYSPVRGKDYWTEADKAEMVSAVISALPIYNGEVVEV